MLSGGGGGGGGGGGAPWGAIIQAVRQQNQEIQGAQKAEADKKIAAVQSALAMAGSGRGAGGGSGATSGPTANRGVDMGDMFKRNDEEDEIDPDYIQYLLNEGAYNNRQNEWNATNGPVIGGGAYGGTGFGGSGQAPSGAWGSDQGGWF